MFSLYIIPRACLRILAYWIIDLLTYSDYRAVARGGGGGGGVVTDIAKPRNSETTCTFYIIFSKEINSRIMRQTRTKLDEIKSLKLQRHASAHIIVSRVINLYNWEGWKLFCISSVKISSVIELFMLIRH